MKTPILLTAACSLALCASAQDMLEPRDATVTMDDNTYSGVTVMLAAEPDEVRDALEDYADDAYGVDFDYKGGIIGRDEEYLITKEAYDLPGFGDRPVYLRARIVESGDGSEMTLFGAYEGNVAIEPEGRYADAFVAVREMTDDFLEDFVPSYYRERVGEVEANIEDLEDDIEKFNDKIADNEDEIENLKQENEELRNNIAEAKRMLEAKGEKLDDREDDLEEAVDKVNGQ